jgi:type IV pilus assembly protein PilM
MRWNLARMIENYFLIIFKPLKHLESEENMQRILGLDMGSYSLKGIVVEHDYTNFKVIDYFEKAIPSHSHTQEEYDLRQKAIRDLVDQFRFYKIEQSYVGLSAINVSCRKMSFKNVKKKDLPQLVQSELENLCQFNIEDFLTEYELVSEKEDERDVLSFMCSKNLVKNYLTFLNERNISPKNIDVDGNAFSNLIPVLDHHGEVASKNFALIDIGHAKTNVMFYEKGHLKNLITIDFAGKKFTEDLAAAFNLAWNEAETLKHHLSCLYDPKKETSLSEQEATVAKRLTLSAYELMSEIRRTFQMQKLVEDIPLEFILLTGGTSQIKGMAEFFEHELSLKVKKLKVSASHLHFNKQDLRFMPALHQALAYALRTYFSAFNSHLNFRKGELAIRSNYTFILKNTLKVTALALLVGIIAIGTYFYREQSYAKEMQRQKVEFEAHISSILKQAPELRPLIMPLKGLDFEEYAKKSLQLIEKQISLEKKLLQEFSAKNRKSPLHLIELLSQHIPIDYKFEITSLKIKEAKIQFDAEAIDASVVDTIIDLLAQAPFLKDVKKLKQDFKPGMDGKIITFSCQALISEDSNL